MATAKKKRKRRPTVTFDAGEQGVQLLDALEKYIHGIGWDEKYKRGISNYRSVTRSMVIRWAVIELAKKEGVEVPTGYRPW